MKRIIVALIVALLVQPVPAHAYTYSKYVTITLTGSTAGGFLASDINAGNGHPQAAMAVCRVQTSSSAVNVRTDGTTATIATSGGISYAPGDGFALTDPKDIGNLSAISIPATSATLNCQIYG